MSINNLQIKITKVKGFTLMEALIGFLILSIGMLGIASLQAISLKAGKTSVYGTVAMMKVEELFESMRANPVALSSYSGDGVFNACTGSKNCTPEELAQDEMYLWKQNLKTGLPDSVTTEVTVTDAVSPSALATVKIDVSWKERDKGSTSSVDKTYTTTANICTATPC